MGRSRVDKVELTRRDKEIALLIPEGYSNQEIADKLFVTKKYIEHCMARIYKYYNIENGLGSQGSGRVKLAFKVLTGMVE